MMVQPLLASLGALAIAAAALYVGVVGMARLVLGPGETAEFPSLAATAFVAVTIGMLNRRITSLADRLVRRNRVAPEVILLRYSEKIRGSYADQEILAEMARSLRAATGADQAVVWVSRGEVMVPVASDPLADDISRPPTLEGMPLATSDDLVHAISQEGKIIGALSFKRGDETGISPVERSVVEDFAAHAGLVLRNLRLTEELYERVAELEERMTLLRESTRTLVQFHDLERRRIERDIHDGSQQGLVALTIKLKTAERFALKDPKKALQILNECRRIAADAGQTLSDLVQGVQPAVLAEKGIGAAVAEQVKDLSIEIRILDELESRFPAEVETGAFFACMEAIQNALKHARASRIEVLLKQHQQSLVFSVIDDGVGFDPDSLEGTSGLKNVKHRIASLSGQLEVSSSPRTGTRITGRIPQRAAFS
jgi:signal transduction histidine kinase